MGHLRLQWTKVLLGYLSAIGRPVDDRWVFHGIILFNNTQSESLSLLNNSIGLSKDTVGNEPNYIWLLE